MLTGEVGMRVRELVRQTCEAFEIRIVSGVVSQDHVHILVSCSPDISAFRDHEVTEGKDSEQVV
ncbi:putative transposase [Xenorhabdus japonica]|uniref:Putative transposase n=1 Tax=Xenorhabdus japonica TaxID=53341 RepID=A0A1I5BEX7_9GAMM|nr:putative transposase [Xenorhabdus japonica]